MTKRRRRFDSLFKAKVALESLKSGASIAELSEEHSLHRNLIRSWKAQLLESAPLLFSPENSDENTEQKKSNSATTRKLARLEEENEFLKKKLDPFLTKSEKSSLN